MIHLKTKEEQKMNNVTSDDKMTLKEEINQKSKTVKQYDRKTDECTKNKI